MSIDLSNLSEIAERTGPFFFSVLYAVVIAGNAGKAWHDSVHENAPAEDTKLRRRYFIFVASVGAVLTAVSVVFFVMVHPVERTYRLEGTFQRLERGEEISSPDLYLHIDYGPAAVSNSRLQQRWNARFVAFSNRPFAPDQSFTIYFRKPQGPWGEGDWDEIDDVKLADGSKNFQVRFDPQVGQNVVVPVKPVASPGAKNTSRFSLDLIPDAYAAPVNKTPLPPVVLDPASTAALTRTLQDERVYTGAEIGAIDKLLRASASDRNTFARIEGPIEPMLLTLLDLQRHNDQELSFKAQALIKSIPVRDILIEKLRDPATAASYRGLLRRIEPQLAVAAIDGVATPSAELRRLRPQLTEEKARLLTASSSSTGDRYWISGDWRSTDLRQAGCVARVFVAPSLAPLKNTIIEPTRRLSWAYSKRAVLEAADALEKCGSAVTFAPR